MAKTIFIDDTSATRFDKVTSKEDKGVDTMSLAHDRSAARWQLTDSLRGGSDSMRDESVTWLTPFPGETQAEYRARLHRSFLLGAYGDALDKLVSKPFSREITFEGEDELPDPLQMMHEDVARDGTKQSPFWRDVFMEAVDRGLTFVLVDFQKTGGTQSAGAETKLKLHPYMVHIKPPQLLAVDRRMRAVDGKSERESVRIHFVGTEKLGQYGEQEVERIHVYTAPHDVSGIEDQATLDALADNGALTSMFESFRKNPKTEEWETDVEPTAYSFDGIPLRALYFCQVGDDEGRPCLWKLAEANLEHYQKKSDRDNLMHVAHVPVLIRYGWTLPELRKNMVFGGARSMGTTQNDARTEYVDARPAAAALEMSRLDIEHLEEQMERLGLEPLVRRASSSLATNMAIGDAKEMNLLQAWALLLESFIVECYEVAAEWVDAELPDDFRVDIFSEYGLSSKASENVALLDKARARGDISHELYLQELKRYGVLAESLDVDDEMERVEDEKANAVDGMVAIMGGAGAAPFGGGSDGGGSDGDPEPGNAAGVEGGQEGGSAPPQQATA